MKIYVSSNEKPENEKGVDLQIEMAPDTDRVLRIDRFPVEVEAGSLIYLSCVFAKENQGYNLVIDNEAGHVLSLFGFKSAPQDPCILYSVSKEHVLQIAINI